MQLIVLQNYINYTTAMQWFKTIQTTDKEQDALQKEKIFVLEHNNVYTAGKSISNDANQANIQQIYHTPVIYTNRGGKWTWHGIGQVVVYFIYNLRTRKLFISNFLNTIEKVVVKNITFELERLCNKPLIQTNLSVYTDSEKRGFWIKTTDTFKIAKIGFIGLHVTNGFVYHGISINYSNDLKFFDYIDPCGLGDVKITSIKETANISDTNKQLDINNFKRHLGDDLLDALDTLHG